MMRRGVGYEVRLSEWNWWKKWRSEEVKMNIVDNRPTAQTFKPYVGPEILSDDDHVGEASSSRTDGGLSARLADKKFDPVTFVVTKVEPSAFASQLTLMDLPVFQAIRPEELSSCAWNKKEKLVDAPNVVAFTRRFNQVCLWAQKEILSSAKPSKRADTIAHFIRIAKKLAELSNLHSCFAIVSALDSSPIFRLSQSWPLVTANNKAALERMRKLFSEERNWERLRRHVDGLRLPAIPYLGLYLTDLLYIDLAHPKGGGLPTDQRETQMNNILRILADFQRSEYPPSLCPPLPCVRDYLASQAYIDELQKFLEDDLYKLSLEREPKEETAGPSSSGAKPMASRRESHPLTSLPRQSKGGGSSSCASPGLLGGRMQLVAKTSSLTPNASVVFRPSHRKTSSLGSQAAHQLSLAPSSKDHSGVTANETFPSLKRHLLDDSLLDVDSSCTGSSSLASSHFVPDTDDSGAESSDAPGLTPGSSAPCVLPSPLASSTLKGQIQGSLLEEGFLLEGAVKRKTLLKDGKRPGMASGWVRYWLGLAGNHLFYYPARPIPNRHPDSRVAFKRKASKMLSVAGWMVVMGEDPFHPDSFQLQEPSRGTLFHPHFKRKASKMLSVAGWMVVMGEDPFHPDSFQLQEPSRGTLFHPHFKRKASKMLSVAGWMVVMGEDPFHPDSFQLQEPSRGTLFHPHFKRKASKMLSVAGWMVVMGEDPFHPDSFQLQEPSRGTLFHPHFKRKASKMLSVAGWMVVMGEDAFHPDSFQLQEPSRGTLFHPHFKRKASKMLSVAGWMVVMGEDAFHPDSFQLQEPSRGTLFHPHFKRKASKMLSVAGWMVVMGEDAFHPDSFQLQEPSRGTLFHPHFKRKASKMLSVAGWMVVMGEYPFHPDSFQLQEPSRGTLFHPHFKRKASKMLSVAGWMVVMGEYPFHPDSFQLQEPSRGTLFHPHFKRKASKMLSVAGWMVVMGEYPFHPDSFQLQEPSRGTLFHPHFKRKASKMLSVAGWMVVMGEGPFHPDSFQLQEPSRSNVYKFRAGSQAKAMEWVRELSTASNSHQHRLPANLIAFD